MPIKIQNELPAKKELINESIYVIDENRAQSQDIRPLKICILNLMPIKKDAELDILRMLSNFPIQTEITLMKIKAHTSKNTPQSHLNKFYQNFDELKNEKFDGLIITGAPLELIEYEEVNYWDELCEIFEWSKKNVFSSFHICWAAGASLNHHYGIKKYVLKEKLSGVYRHKSLHNSDFLMRAMDDYFYAPQSRNMALDEEQISKNKELYVVANSAECGSFMILAKNSRQIFITGHLEYDKFTLDKEYKRDLKKGLNPKIPKNYYEDNDPNKEPILSWRAAANAVYSNWLNFIYQETPYDLEKLEEIK